MSRYKKDELAVEIANHVETHKDYDRMSKREAVMATVRLLTDDIGAAQQFCYAIGLEVDLYGVGTLTIVDEDDGPVEA